MYCEWCGEFIDDNAKKCPNCGKKNPFYKKPKASRKKSIITLSIVIPLIVVIVTAILVVGFAVEIPLYEDFGINMHKFIVHNSEKAPIVTMKSTRTVKGVVISENTYAFDSERQICYYQRISRTNNAYYDYLEFSCYDIANGKEYSCTSYSNGSYLNGQYTSSSSGKIALTGQTIKTPTYSWDNIKSSVINMMSTPGIGCSATSYTVLFKGDCDIRFHFATPTKDRVLAEGYKVKKINFNDEVYEFSYEYIESEYFTLK